MKNMSEENAPVTFKDWTEASVQIGKNAEKIGEHDNELGRLRKKIEGLQKSNYELPMSIQEAVTKGIQPVLDRVLEYDNKFQQLELQRVQDEKDRLQARLEEQKEREKYFRRTVFTAFLTSVISGVVGFYISIFLNNL